MGVSLFRNPSSLISVRRFSISLRSLWFIINVVLWTIIFASAGIIGSLFEWRGKFLSWIAQSWSKWLLAIGGIKYRVIGLSRLDPKGHFVFAANHESALDIPLVFAGLPFHVVSIAKIELKWMPIFGWAMMAGGHFFVDRRKHKKALNSLEKAKSSMTKNPRSIIIFPEGTRSLDGEIKPFKKGGLILALRMGVPVVPIALCGTGNAMKKKGLTLKNQTLELRIGEPIQTRNINFDERNQFVADVREKVVVLRDHYRHAA
ncbi:MAG: lysophospholipid acyltransferase family protein [Candidatus Marinimicrobia bacterium]|nr:lysophospholipid acyltransferase family protein [Candidatus Neomarinimicrobiota bacterium]